ncbi:MAG: hypothetical protein M3Y77_08670 [Actinomycetota bacterium]|nr:hypothetical protein [Actinomycetota bacterium]MDQ2956317.1 hypothetical protein [Actinomycetota bacterium]
MSALVRSGLVLTLVAGVVSAAQLAVAPQVGRALADTTTGSDWRGRVLYLVQVTVRVQFIAVP